MAQILIVSLNFAPERTATGKTTFGRARHLAQAGHEVTVVAGFPHYPEWRVHEGYRRRVLARDEIDGVKIVRGWHTVPSRPSAFGRASMEASFALTSLLATGRVEQPDLVLGVFPILADGLAAWATARRFHVPFGLFVQDLSGRAAAQSGMRGARRLTGTAERVERFLMRRADRIAIITDGFRRPIEAYGVAPERIRLLPDWTPVESPTVPRNDVRRRMGWPLDRPVALHTGNMGYKQALENVIDAACIAQQRGSDISFVLVGDGNQREQLVHRAQQFALQNLTFMPLQDEAVYASMLGAADVLILNQRATLTDMSFPSKLAGYMASGRPVVAAVNRGSEAAREVVASDGGVLVPPEDPPSLLAALQGLVDDPVRAVSLGHRAQEYALDRWSTEEIARSLESFVESVANGAGRHMRRCVDDS